MGLESSIKAVVLEIAGFAMDFMPFLFAFVGIILGFGLAWTILSSRSSNMATQLAALQEEKQQLQSQSTQYHERAVKAETDLKNEREKATDQQKILRAEFKDTTEKLLEQMSNKFSSHSEKKIGDLLNPMQQHLNEFKKLVVDKFDMQGKEQHTLKSEIEKIVLQADSLTKALRGDVKAQGNWGEIMLERILEESGLRRDEDYVLQGESLGMKASDGSHQKPDVIVRLPDDKHIIIDSKVSLTAYDRYCNSNDDNERVQHARQFVDSIKSHVVGLEKKRYQDSDKLGTPDFVLLFMPTEGAFSFAVQQDKELHSFAWSRRIAIVSPTNLFAILRTVASLWKIDRQNQNAKEIAEQGGRLYDKFAGFVENMEKVGKQLVTVQSTYDVAFKQLSAGKGNLISSAEKLKALGARTSKALPSQYADEGSESEVA
ncbi:MAG: DNA recombination protein RmuC [Alphaproteobacteria bacterium]